jgi:hypothetical protein
MLAYGLIVIIIIKSRFIHAPMDKANPWLIMYILKVRPLCKALNEAFISVFTTLLFFRFRYCYRIQPSNASNSGPILIYHLEYGMEDITWGDFNVSMPMLTTYMVA